MSRFTRWVLITLLIICLLGLITPLIGGDLPNWLIVPALFACGIMANQIARCARYRRSGESLLACLSRRGQEQTEESHYALALRHPSHLNPTTVDLHAQTAAYKAEYENSSRAGRNQAYRHPALLSCGHTVIIWTQRPIASGQLVDCPLHNAWGPAVAMRVQLPLPAAPTEIAPIVHLSA